MLVQNLEQARFNMAEQQIRPWDVFDQRVLDVIQQIPRENFVPQEYKGVAFADTEIPLGHDQFMMAPRLEARMLQALAIKASDRVLEIGTGSGFVTACLATLGNSVVSYEINQELLETARDHLALAGITNVRLHNEDAFTASLPKSTYDVVAVTGSLPEYVDTFEQLLTPGGRLFVIAGESPVMEAMLITRRGEDLYQRENLFETDLPALQGISRSTAFSF